MDEAQDNIWDDSPIEGFGEEALAEADRRIDGRLKYMRDKITSKARKRPSRLKVVLDGRKPKTTRS